MGLEVGQLSERFPTAAATGGPASSHLAAVLLMELFIVGVYVRSGGADVGTVDMGTSECTRLVIVSRVIIEMGVALIGTGTAGTRPCGEVKMVLMEVLEELLTVEY